jgi:hypothetical protein
MSTRTTKRFCVRLRVGSCFKLTVRAKSANEAIAKAQKLWQAGNVEAFTIYPIEVYDWGAEEPE